MKVKAIILLTTIILIISCSEKTDEITFDFLPNQNSVIKFEIKNCLEPQSFTLLQNKTLPRGQILQTIELNSDSIFYVKKNLSHPSYIVLIENKKGTDFFIIPNDTLCVKIDYSSEGNIQFSGKTGSVSKYLANVRKHFYSGPLKNQNPDSYNLMIDSIFDHELYVIDSLLHKKKLLSWFVNIEKENIYHERDFCKFNQYSQRLWMYNQYIQKPDEFIKTINLNEMNYYWLDNTIMLLGMIHHKKYDTLLQSKYRNKQIYLA